LLPCLLALALLAAPAKPALEERRAEVAKQILHLAGRLQREIEAGDASALLARVPAEGLRCGDRLVPRARVEHDLRTEGSWLHAVFFGGPGAPAPSGQPSSLRAFFATAKEIAVVVEFQGDPRSELGRPCFTYRARDTLAPGAPLCFEQRGGQWWFTESLYPC
jgi:hypothetical protein